MFRALCLIVVLSSGCHPTPQAMESRGPRPNAEPRAKRALLITIDTLRADVLSVYGGAARTPELDAWAASGWRFTRAYSASMLTNPSHASIFTSLNPRDHGVYDNQSGIADSVRTLPGELRQAGFATGALVAFPHLNPNVANLARGFDRFLPATREERRANSQVQLALSELEALGSDKFFYWLHLGDPHAPYEPVGDVRSVLSASTPTERARRVSPSFQRNNPWFKRAFDRFARTEQFFHRYIAEVEAVDRALKTLREQLQANGLWDDLLVVVTSDHGESFGNQGLWFHHGGLYDDTVHVPLILRGPGLESAIDSRLVEHVDIAPTVVDLLRAARWEPVRGRSLLAQRAGRTPKRTFAFSEHMLKQAVSVRDGDWLRILHRKTSNQFPSYPLVAGRRELWRIDSQGVWIEARGLDTESNPEVGRLDRAIDRYLESGIAWHARDAVNQDRESLRALGYLE